MASMLQLEASLKRTHYIIRSIIFRTLEGIVPLSAWSIVDFWASFVSRIPDLEWRTQRNRFGEESISLQKPQAGVWKLWDASAEPGRSR